MGRAELKNKFRLKKLLSALVTLGLDITHSGDSVPVEPGDVKLSDYYTDL